jgi:hypothetical protein
MNQIPLLCGYYTHMDRLLPEIYQFRIWLKGTSPMVWRRLLVKANTSIEDFHYIMQIIMNWTDSNLHQFIIYGKSYGVSHNGGFTFSNDPTQILLGDHAKLRGIIL